MGAVAEDADEVNENGQRQEGGGGAARPGAAQGGVADAEEEAGERQHFAKEAGP